LVERKKSRTRWKEKKIPIVIQSKKKKVNKKNSNCDPVKKKEVNKKKGGQKKGGEQKKGGQTTNTEKRNELRVLRR